MTQLEKETCCVCGELATGKCGHCDNPYCDKHYGSVVCTGNCCRENEKDWEEQ
ncbi:MAG: hypothetical protein KCHDKBKB_00693 [Elusimicrobia bacterium]|nr:hypothetical protein [Elusimicrobiota bacterium]